MNTCDDSSARREIRLLYAFLRDEEERRRRVLREISALRLWEHAPGHSHLTRWIAGVAVGRRHAELEAVDRSIRELRAKLEELLGKMSREAAHTA